MKLFKYLFAIVFLLIAATGCDDKEEVGPKLPLNTELIFSSSVDIYDVNLGQFKNWKIESYPEWATPMQKSGTIETEISIFVEANFSEEERKGEMIVVADKKEIVYSLLQRSTLTDDSNASIVKDRLLSRTYGVGMGIDVFKVPRGAKYSFANNTIVNSANIVDELSKIGEFGEADAYLAEDHYYSHTEAFSGTSITSLSTQLSVNAGIEAEICGFSGSLSGKFTNDESSSTNTAYAIREIKHIVGSRYLRPGALRNLIANNKTRAFSSGFNNAVKEIKDNPQDKDAIYTLLDRYGTHLIVHGSVGGELELAMEMTSTETISEMDINAVLNASCAVVNADGSFDMSDHEKKLLSNTRISLKTYGGNNAYILAPGATFEEAMKYVLEQQKIEEWVTTIKEKTSLALVDVQLYPIYDLMPDSATRAAVREYMINEYQVKKTQKKPLLFAVNGFGDNAVIEGQAYIDALDIKLECYNEFIPEISDKERVTMIYTGTKDEMDYSCGFFIGSNTLQPGKLRKNREGIYSFEPFDELNPGQITELYVNATGDITIAGKPGVAYSEVKFTGMTKEFMSKNRAPSTVEATTDATRYHVGSPSLLISDNIKNWLYKYSDYLLFRTTCAIDLNDEDCIKEAINLGNINLVLEYSKPKEYMSKYIYLYFYNSEVEIINSYDLVTRDKDKVECEYSITPEVNYIGISTSCEGSDDVPKVFDEESIKVYFKFTHKNTPRWK